MGLAISAVLLVIALAAVSKFGTLNKVKREADRLADQIWEVRSRATSGVFNPCLDFPTVDSVRIFSDTSQVPDGFGPGDRVLGGYRYQGGVRSLTITGGIGSRHSICFRTRGVIGSASAPLEMTIGMQQNDPTNRRLRLMPSTGVVTVR